MSAPVIRSTSQSIQVDGVGRNDLVIGSQVTCTDINLANTGHDYLWSFVDIPIGSVAGITNATTQTCNFTPDVTGSYFIMCQVDGLEFAREILAVPLPKSGVRIPAFSEEVDYTGESNMKGWHTTLTAFMRRADAVLDNTLSTVYNAGSDALAQKMIITDAHGGPVVFDGSSISFTDPRVIKVLGSTSDPSFTVLTTGGIEIGPGTSILISAYGNPSSLSGVYSVVIGPGTSATSDYSTVIGQGAAIGAAAIGSTVYGVQCMAHDGASYSCVVGDNSHTYSPGSTVVGDQVVVMTGADGSVAIGGGFGGYTIGDGCPNGVAIGTNNHIGTTLTLNPGLVGNSNSLVIGTNASTSDGSNSNILVGSTLFVDTNTVSTTAIGSYISIGPGGNRVSVLGHGDGSHTITVGSDCTNIFSIGAGVGDSSSDVLAIGVMDLGSMCQEVLLAGDNCIVGSSLVRVVAVGATLTLGNHLTSMVVVGDHISLPDYAGYSVVLGEDAYATNASVAIGQGAQVGFGGIGGNGNVVLGQGTTIGVSSNNCVSISSSTVGDHSSAFAAQQGTIGTASLGCVAIASSQIGNSSSGCTSFAYSQIGDGAENCFAASEGYIDNSVLYGFAAAGGSVYANHGIAIGQGAEVDGVRGIALGYAALATANQCVIGDVSGPIHDFVIRSATINTFEAIDNPVSSGDTGITLAYNNGSTVENKMIKAAISPPTGALILYLSAEA